MAWMRMHELGFPRSRAGAGGRAAATALAVLLLAACSKEGGRSPSSEGGGTGGEDTGLPPDDTPPDLGVGDIDLDPNSFPSEPILEDGITTAEIEVFSDPEQFSPGVCVYEPHLSDANGPGALYPMNWLRPRFRWTGTGSETLWEIRWRAESQNNELRAYTRNTQWILPREIWEKVSRGVLDDITVTVRGNGPDGLTGMRGDFRITPALAGGAMVFWGTSSSVVEPGSSRLFGFTMGDEAVVDVLRAEQVDASGILQANGRDMRGESVSSSILGIETGAPRCVGCHVSTPDGTAMAFTDDYPWNMAIASVEENLTGTVPTYVSAGARELLKIPFLGTAAMLPAPWLEGDRTMIATMGRRDAHIYINYGDKPEPTVHDLIWIDLQANATIPTELPAAAPECEPMPPWPDDCYTGWPRDEASQQREAAILEAQGTAWDVLYSDPAGSISNPVSSNAGDRLAYAVSESSVDGHPDWHNNTADIRVLSLTGPRAAAGAAAPLEGASSPGFLEYYPAFSPDDLFVAFNRAPAPSNTSRCREGVGEPPCVNNPASLGENPDGPYYNRKGEIYVVPSVGAAEPHRLRGNDPVACSGETSPGVLNSWAKWSSAVREYEGKNYYFVIFSSARAYEGQFNLMPTAFTPPIETKSSHLYMSVIEHDPETGALTSYAPIYLWNQNYLVTGPDTYEDLQTANLTPAWEDFSIPMVPPEVIVR